MKFERAALSAGHLWSSPFVRWQGSLADVSSLDLAVAVTARRAGGARLRREPGRADRPRHDDPAAGRVLRRAMDRRPARHGRHRRAAHRAGLRDLGRLHRRRGDGGRGRAAPLLARRHRRPHQQRPLARLPAQPRDGRQPGDRELGARQLRRRSVDPRVDGRDRRSGGARGRLLAPGDRRGDAAALPAVRSARSPTTARSSGARCSRSPSAKAGAASSSRPTRASTRRRPRA